MTTPISTDALQRAFDPLKAAALLSAGRRRNGRYTITPDEAIRLARLFPDEQRKVIGDLTFLFNGLRYSAARLPGVFVGACVLVAPQAGAQLEIRLLDAAPQNTSAAQTPLRNSQRTGRASSRPQHSGRPTSVGKKAPTGNAPSRHKPSPAILPARWLRRTEDSDSAEVRVRVEPLDAY